MTAPSGSDRIHVREGEKRRDAVCKNIYALVTPNKCYDRPREAKNGAWWAVG
jgi:hypothetical protein